MLHHYAMQLLAMHMQARGQKQSTCHITGCGQHAGACKCSCSSHTCSKKHKHNECWGRPALWGTAYMHWC